MTSKKLLLIFLFAAIFACILISEIQSHKVQTESPPTDDDDGKFFEKLILFNFQMLFFVVKGKKAAGLKLKPLLIR